MANEKRLIDANALYATLGKLAREPYYQHEGEDYYVGIADATGEVALCPTVDAVEVVHGRWECTYDAERGETDVTCSHCKSTRTINGCYVTSTGESCYFEDNYCPNCGAKMEGGNNNEI